MILLSFEIPILRASDDLDCSMLNWACLEYTFVRIHKNNENITETAFPLTIADCTTVTHLDLSKTIETSASRALTH